MVAIYKRASAAKQVEGESVSNEESSPTWLDRRLIICGIVALIAALLTAITLEPVVEEAPVSSSSSSSSTALVALTTGASNVPAVVEDVTTTTSRDVVQVLQQLVSPSVQQQADIIAWMQAGGAVFPQIEIVEYAAEYRGIHAKTDIDPNTVLAVIPDQFIVTFEKARDSEIGQRLISLLPEYGSLDMSHYLIAPFLMYEYQKGTQSWWWPYLQTLPKEFDNMPPNFTPEEIKLADESRLDTIIDDSLQSDYNEICDVWAEFCQQYSLQLYKWARLVVRSRAFSLDRNGVDQTALQPFVDMINHDFDGVASWRYDQAARSGQIYSKKAIKAGDPVTISYGAKCNRLLLKLYGFVVQHNPVHEAQLYLQLPDGEAKSGMLARRVAKSGNPKTEFFLIRYTITLSTSDEEFQAAMKLCRISVATADELDRHDDFAVPVSLRNEVAALRYLQESIDTELFKHKTTMEDDEQLLARSTSLTVNERNIIQTRLSEKSVLLAMNNVVEDLLDLADPAVQQETFNKRRFLQKYAKHQKYVRTLRELRRAARSMVQ